jgi:hypothetical protein
MFLLPGKKSMGHGKSNDGCGPDSHLMLCAFRRAGCWGRRTCRPALELPHDLRPRRAPLPCHSLNPSKQALSRSHSSY